MCIQCIYCTAILKFQNERVGSKLGTELLLQPLIIPSYHYTIIRWDNISKPSRSQLLDNAQLSLPLDRTDYSENCDSTCTAVITEVIHTYGFALTYIETLLGLPEVVSFDYEWMISIK